MKLIERPVRSIVRAITDAAERWTNADFPPRVRALAAVCERTGYSIPVVEYGFDRLFAPLTRNAIEATIASELGSLDVLDDFVATAGRPRARALPVGRIAVLSSRTTIGVALVPAIFALCAKCDVLVKDREDALIASFFATLGEELDDLRDAAIAQGWDGERDPRDLGSFAAVVAFGNDATLARIRAGLAPDARWIAFGSKASCGYVGRDALADAASAESIAFGAARDLVLYETQGCLSLHVLFVEQGGVVSPKDFSAMLARSVERAGVEFPAGERDAAVAGAVAAARDSAAFRASLGAGATHSNAEVAFLVVHAPPDTQPPLFLPRALTVYAVDSPAGAAAYVARHHLSIEAIAVAGSPPEIRETAIRCGAARIADFGTLQSPPLGGYHGGRSRIAEFVRWVSDET